MRHAACERKTSEFTVSAMYCSVKLSTFFYESSCTGCFELFGIFFERNRSDEFCPRAVRRIVSSQPSSIPDVITSLAFLTSWHRTPLHSPHFLHLPWSHRNSANHPTRPVLVELFARQSFAPRVQTPWRDPSFEIRHYLHEEQSLGRCGAYQCSIHALPTMW